VSRISNEKNVVLFQRRYMYIIAGFKVVGRLKYWKKLGERRGIADMPDCLSSSTNLTYLGR
jgi:hypothetical protein